jgi:hypothetical protein
MKAPTLAVEAHVDLVGAAVSVDPVDSVDPEVSVDLRAAKPIPPPNLSQPSTPVLPP